MSSVRLSLNSGNYAVIEKILGIMVKMINFRLVYEDVLEKYSGSL